MEKQNLNLEDIKVGETYNVRVKVEHIDEDGYLKVRTSEKAISFILSPKELEAFSPLPKYDPCREFREGDKVRMRERDGRLPYCTRMREHIVPSDTILTVAANLGNGLVAVRADGNLNEQVIGFYFLELVTPEDELEPYSVETGGYNRFRIKKGNLEYSYFPFGEHCVLSMDEAKAAAEAECDRLNAEWRKEQE